MEKVIIAFVSAVMLVGAVIAWLWMSRQDLSRKIRQLEIKQDDMRHSLGYVVNQYIMKFVSPAAKDLAKSLPVLAGKAAPQNQFSKLCKVVGFGMTMFFSLGTDVADAMATALHRHGITFEHINGGKGASSHTYRLHAGSGLVKNFEISSR